MAHISSAGDNTVETIQNNIEVKWEKTTDIPFPLREGQCACSHGNNLYIFGGIIQNNEDPDALTESNDLLCFNTVECTWSHVEAKGTVPPPRSAASLVCVGKKLYLFGGLNNEDGWLDDLHSFDLGLNNEDGWLDDLHSFDLDTCTWSVVTSEGTKPSARDKLQGSVVDDSIYYFGGFGPKHVDNDEDWEDMEDEDDDDIIDEEREQQAAQFGWFNDLYKFDIVNKKWSQPMHMNLGVPTARAAHGMCTVDREIVIFGGRDIEQRTNDLHMFNVDTRKWRTDMKIKGLLPPERSFHSVTAVGSRVVVIGGRGIDNDHFSDLHIFDTETSEWLQPKISGDKPSKRGQHSAVTVGNKLLLFGGSSGFIPETMSTSKTYGDTYSIPIGISKRGQHFAVTVGNKLMLFGGSSGFVPETMSTSKTYGDTYSIPIADILKGGSTQQKEPNGHIEQNGS